MKIYLKISLLFFFTQGFAQTNDINDIQYGIAFKTTIDLNWHYPNYNIGVVGGIGGHPFDAENIYPSVHGGVLLYNHGELVSSYENGFFKSYVVDFILDLTVSFGLYRDNINFAQRVVPLYHFADFTPNPLQNPFQNSFSLGSNLILSNDDYRRQDDLFQRIGFSNLMVDRHFQISIINDGSIWRKLGLADGLDRFYTGGGVISYHRDSDQTFDLLEFSFYKFTGHEKYAFDTATLLQMDFIPFKKDTSYYYNKNRYRLSMSNNNEKYGLHLTFHNADRDIQDYIHLKGNYSYHPDVFIDKKGFWNELLKVGLGGYYLVNNHNFTN